MSLKLISIIIFLLSLLSPPMPAQAAPANLNEIPPTTLVYLQSQQQSDGGMPGLGGLSDPGTTARTLLALKGLGIDPDLLTSSAGISASQYLANHYQTTVYDANGQLFPASAGLILAAQPQLDGKPNPLAAELNASLQADGSYATPATSDFVNGAASATNQIFAILGLSAAGNEIPEASVQYLINLQLPDGTWDNGFGSDPDTTAMALIALLSSGQVALEHPAVVKTLDYFASTQLDNGGWRPAWDSSDVNVDTTGWISLALTSAAEDPAGWSKNGKSPVDAILSQLQPDGSIGGEFVNVYSTVEALLGLANSPIFSEAPPQSGTTPTTGKAALVVTLADGSSLLRCVTFSGDNISGVDLVSASGLSLETAVDPARGMAVCSIEGEGCPVSNCFCDMPNYWSYWHWQDGAWNYASAGSSSYVVSDGALEGWTYSDGQEPPQVSFEQICAETPLLYLPAVAREVPTVTSPTPQSTQFLMLPAIGSPEKSTSNVPKVNVNTILYGVLALLIVAIIILTVTRNKPS